MYRRTVRTRSGNSQRHAESRCSTDVHGRHKTTTMSKCEIFQIVFDSLQRQRDVFIQDVTTAVVAIMVAIGWIATSEKCRGLLSQRRGLRAIALTVVCVAAVCVVSLLLADYFAIRRGLQILDALAITAQDHYHVVDIPRWQLAVDLVLTGSLFAMLGALLWWNPEADRSKSDRRCEVVAEIQ